MATSTTSTGCARWRGTSSADGRNRLVYVLADNEPGSDHRGMAARRIVIAGFPALQSLDVIGPAEVFAMASRLAGDGVYSIELVANAAEPIEMSNGLELVARPLGSARGPIDTLVAAGGAGVEDAIADETLVRWLRSAAGRSRRVASVCSGAFLLAAAGLLDGRRATTHWAACDELARRHPSVTVEEDAIFVRDGHVWSSAGVTAGMDLALALVEDDLGPEAAREVARWLVLFLRRPGGQSQFSAQLAAAPAGRAALRDLQAWIPAHLAADLSVPALAARTHMSARNFARAFRAEVGMTPAAYVESVRVEQARIALEGSRAPVEEVARRCGFGTVETLRRAFQRRLGVGPSAYRNRFRPATKEVA
jgi:transcriptional regulator GlxA family with amidase domain